MSDVDALFARHPRPAPTRRRALMLALVSLSGWSAHARAQSVASALELQVKAAYLYKFAGYTEWPEGSFAQSDSALVIGVAGHDALAGQLELVVAGRSINGHPLTVRRLKRGDSPAGLHILCTSAADRSAMIELLGQARALPILTVADDADGLAHGAMIAFLMAQDRLRFDVGLKPVNQARLRISARMLAVAHQVQGAT